MSLLETDSNRIRTHLHLVRKRTLNHLAKLAKSLVFLMNVLPDVYICSLRKKSAPVPEGTVKCSQLVHSKLQKTLTEINESGAIAK